MDGRKTQKKINNIYDKYLTFDNLYSIYNIVRKTCKNKKGLYEFQKHLYANINDILCELKDRTYKPYRFYPFLIFEPKPRLVMNQTVKDKIVNHFVANYYLMPFLEKSLIETNVATRKGKGTKYLMDTLKSYFNKIMINNPNQEIYVLKMDVEKFFYRIDHQIIIDKLKKRIKDKDVINLIKIIIGETNQDYINEYIIAKNKQYNLDIPLYKNNKGMSIGAQISQFLAIYYLNDLDHFIKEKLKCKHYVRYMDDLILLDTDKEKLKSYFKLICEEIKKDNLNFNKKSNIYRASIGFNYVGKKYKIKNNKLYIFSNKKTYKKIKHNLEKKQKCDYLDYLKSLASYQGFLKMYIINVVKGVLN